MLEGIGGFNSQSYAQANRFDRLDSNGSGGIDKSELQAQVDKNGAGEKLLENFDRVDIDGNGELDVSELKEARSHAKGGVFDRVDLNGSGGLDIAEIQANVEQLGRSSKVLDNFSEIDQDGSGEVSMEEIRYFFTDDRADNDIREIDVTA
jgi:Ca2+-binding EF-hand superfamily protein